MSQATPICPHSAELCRVRVTALNADGSVASGPNNSYVSDSPIQLGVTPEVKAGTSTDVTNGCGCVCVTRRTPDIVLRNGIVLQTCAIEPALESILLGSEPIEDQSDIPVVIGVKSVSQQSCDSPALVAIEAWSEAWDYDSQHLSPNRWIYWLYPAVQFHIDNYVLADGFMLPQYAGVTKGNPNWGEGPYGDIGFDLGTARDMKLWVDDIPDADCAFASVGSS